jgi:hypothetical protein
MRIFSVAFHPVKAQETRECTSVLKSEDYKTQMLMLLGEISFVIGPDCIFCKLVRRMRLISLTVWKLELYIYGVRILTTRTTLIIKKR